MNNKEFNTNSINKVILKKDLVKTEKDLFSIFSLKKSPILKLRKTNEFIESFMTKDILNDESEFGSKIENSIEIEGMKNLALQYLIKYFTNLGITLPINIKEEIDVSLHIGGENISSASAAFKSIKINNAHYSQLSLEGKVLLLVHEILHLLATKNHKMFYDYEYHKNRVNVDNLFVDTQTGFKNPFIGGYKRSIIGEGINEGFTDLISLNVLHGEEIDVEYSGLGYINYIYIIDKLIIEIAKKVNQSYEEVFNYFIQGNLMGDNKCLQLIEEHISKECLIDVMNLGFTNSLPGTNRDVFFEAQTKTHDFINKYAFLFEDKRMSKGLISFIGDSDYIYNG